ncbi:MAG TPA: hypothetical protein VJJ01_02625 [Nitrosopumilaceae archaeon]|nr:hypothetical protein [Nitrosopumilaceae archaeon]
MTSLRDAKYENEVSDPKVSAGEPIDLVDLQFLRNQIVKEYKRSEGFAKSEWLTLEKQSLVNLILETFADDDKREIMYSTLYSPKTITEILDICKIPKTSGYRIINSMIENYLLVPTSSTKNGQRTLKKYSSTIENVQIETIKDKIFVRVKFAKRIK